MMEIKYSKRYYDVCDGIPSIIVIGDKKYKLSIYESIFTKNLIVSYYQTKGDTYLDYDVKFIFLEYDSSYSSDEIILDVNMTIDKCKDR